jgi:protein-disulfide isomerase
MVEPPDRTSIEPVAEAVDHVRGPEGTRVIVEYGDYECPYSRQAYRNIERVESRLEGNVRFVFRHFPLTQIHPHALAAARAAEAPARFEGDRAGDAMLQRIRRDIQSAEDSGQVLGTPTLFIDGVLHSDGYDFETLLEALAA